MALEGEVVFGRVEVAASFPSVHTVTHVTGEIVGLFCSLGRLVFLLTQQGACNRKLFKINFIVL
jgi:hypothetical protein